MNEIVIDARMINSSGIGTYLQNMIPNLIKNHDLILLGREKEIKSFSWGKRSKQSILKVQYILLVNS